jgi:glycosyl transferase family 25
MSKINNINDIKHAFYINLEHRIDRKEHVQTELNNIGIKAERFNAIKMDNGAIGCSMSHLKLLQEALKNKLEHVLIVEDDIKFLNPDLFKTQFNKFIENHGNNWDVILLAGNNMPPYQKIDETCIQVSRCQTTTGYLVNGHYIKVLLQNVKMGLTHLLQKPDEHAKFAIDKFWFVLQNNSKWYLITPPTVVQREDYSDIEKKITNYEKIMVDLDKAEMFKAIKQMRQNEFINKQKQNKKLSTNSL